jgi:hypothetical protein
MSPKIANPRESSRISDDRRRVLKLGGILDEIASPVLAAARLAVSVIERVGKSEHKRTLNQARPDKLAVAKDVTKTIRLDGDLDRAIQERAREAHVSVNFIVNRLIGRFIDWDTPGREVRDGRSPVVSIRRLYDEIDDERSKGLGGWKAQEFYKAVSMYLFGELTFETSILLFRRISEYGTVRVRQQMRREEAYPGHQARCRSEALSLQHGIVARRIRRNLEARSQGRIHM